MDYTNKTIRGRKKKYRIGPPLNNGTGGEGTVYRIKGKRKLVAKIYHDATFSNKSKNRTELEKKLLCMTKQHMVIKLKGKVRVAWPLDVLYGKDGVVGYVMPKIKADRRLYDVWRETSRKHFWHKRTWLDSVYTAHNLAKVVRKLHSRGIIVGDLNQSNIMVDRKGDVFIVDADSFDITDPKKRMHFPCTVGQTEVLAPELQVCNNLTSPNAKFTKNSDDFSLAILVFRLLFSGFHPFAGVLTEDSRLSASSISEHSEIINGNCAYVRSITGRKISPLSPKLQFLPKYVSDLFKRTFDYRKEDINVASQLRPTAKEWERALKKLRKGRIRRCTKQSFHVFPAKNKRCPFCGARKKSHVLRYLLFILLICGCWWLYNTGKYVILVDLLTEKLEKTNLYLHNQFPIWLDTMSKYLIDAYRTLYDAVSDLIGRLDSRINHS